MVKGDKKNKREYERKKAQEEEAKLVKKREELEKRKSKDKPQSGVAVVETNTEQHPPAFKGAREDATKLITEANQRFIKAREEDKEDNSRWKRTITSNWTRYEIESEGENGDEEAEMTGQDWEFAMSSANRAESHIKLKGEQDWDTSGSTGLSTEFFSLDLTGLESIIKCIPLHLQIQLDKEGLDPETLDHFNRTAEQNIRQLESGSDIRAEDLTGKLLGLLSVSEKVGGGQEESVEKITETAETFCDDVKAATEDRSKLGEANKAIESPAQPQEQRQRKKRAKHEQETSTQAKSSPTIESQQPSAAEQLPPQPLEQRQRRRDKKTSVTTNAVAAAPTTPQQPPKLSISSVSEVDEKADLDFLASLEKRSPAQETTLVKEEAEIDELPAAVGGVVPVQILEAEKKDLEDWLDDFLDE